MSDESRPQGIPNPPPPPAASAPPPAPAQPFADTTGEVTRGPDPTSEVAAAPRHGATVTLTLGLVLGLLAIAAVVIGLLVEESDGGGSPSANLWDRTSAPLWSIVAIVAAVATLLPAVRTVGNLPANLAWTIAAIGAGYLVFWWVLFILPEISLNVAFLVTIGVACAVAAVWTSPDNPHRDAYTAS